MTPERLVRAMLLALVGSLAAAAPADAFTPPELYVRLQRTDITHEPASDWILLAFKKAGTYSTDPSLIPRARAPGGRRGHRRGTCRTGAPAEPIARA